MSSLQISHYSLYNAENYKKNINVTSYDIFHKYNLLVLEYLNYTKENIKITDRFIINRGLETITHVFKLMFFYTKNLDMTYYHSQKAFYFYIEFIGQITDDHQNFLQLSSRDAIMFVYKKTIFDISSENQKQSKNLEESDKLKLDCLNVYTHIVKCIYQNNNININKVLPLLNNKIFNLNTYETILSFIQNQFFLSASWQNAEHTLEQYIKHLVKPIFKKSTFEKSGAK
jgi:hypothetical protein